METLFSIKKESFHNALLHIAALKSEVSPELRQMIHKDLRYVTRKKFSTYHVTGLNGIVGCPAAVEVHGDHIFIDETQIRKRDIPIGVYRQALLAGASRQGWGGKKRYDYCNMYTALGCSYATGLTVVHYWPRFMSAKIHALRLPLALAVSFMTVPVVKSLWKAMGIAPFYVSYHYAKATKNLECEKCLSEVEARTIQEIAARKVKKREFNFVDSLRRDLFETKKLINQKTFEGKICDYHQEGGFELLPGTNT